MADLNALLEQAKHLRIKATEQALWREAEVYAAYHSVFGTRAGQIVLEDLIHSYLLRPCKEPTDEGARRVVLRMLEMVREAPERMQGTEEAS